MSNDPQQPHNPAAPAQPNPYAQGYGQPAGTPGQPTPQPYGSPAHTYGTPQAPGTPQPYGDPAAPYGTPAPGYGAVPAGYGNPQQHGQPNFQAEYEKGQRSGARLGVVALICSMVALVVGCIVGWLLGAEYGKLFAELGIDVKSGATPQITPDMIQKSKSGQAVMGMFGLMILPSLIGLAGIVMGFIAVAKSKLKRVWAVLAIVVAFLAPVVCFFVAMAGLTANLR